MAKKNKVKNTTESKPEVEVIEASKPQVIKYKYIGNHPVNVTAIGRVVNPGEVVDSHVIIDNPMFESVE